MSNYMTLFFMSKYFNKCIRIMLNININGIKLIKFMLPLPMISVDVSCEDR